LRIGIIGHGFVGSAVADAHSSDELIIRDPKMQNSASLDQFKNCDAVYVCVPSPPVGEIDHDGHCDTSILEQTLKELIFAVIDKPMPIICKTTAPPSAYARLQKLYPNIVHCPEFLTAANAVSDYANTEYFVLGGDWDWCVKARTVIQKSVMLVSDMFIIVPIKTAALYKYMMNSYLATKVTFMNDFKKIADAEDVTMRDLKYLAGLDKRIGYTHMDTPGPDGQFGWGGGCFPKDIAAIQMEALDLGVDLELLGKVEDLNKKHRSPK
jgi:nucleotide sugar dehydrogenase